MRLHRRKGSLGLSGPARRRCDLAVVFAVSDGEWIGVADLLDSLRLYLDCDFEVLAVDDRTSDGTYQRLLSSGVWVVRNQVKKGLWGLDETIGKGLAAAYRLFEAPFYMKIDPDALVTGFGLVDDIREAFSASDRIGLIGTYRTDWDGSARDLSFWRERMWRERRSIRKPLGLALRNGYELGMGVQGGAYVLRRECLGRLVEMGWFERPRGYRPPQVRGRQIAEDSLITMLTYAAGYVAEDFGGPGQPFGIWYNGLPAPPEVLRAQGRKVVHAIKYSDGESLRLRDVFRGYREHDARRRSGSREAGAEPRELITVIDQGDAGRP